MKENVCVFCTLLALFLCHMRHGRVMAVCERRADVATIEGRERGAHVLSLCDGMAVRFHQ